MWDDSLTGDHFFDYSFLTLVFTNCQSPTSSSNQWTHLRHFISVYMASFCWSHMVQGKKTQKFLPWQQWLQNAIGFLSAGRDLSLDFAPGTDLQLVLETWLWGLESLGIPYNIGLDFRDNLEETHGFYHLFTMKRSGFRYFFPSTKSWKPTCIGDHRSIS